MEVGLGGSNKKRGGVTTEREGGNNFCRFGSKEFEHAQICE